MAVKIGTCFLDVNSAFTPQVPGHQGRTCIHALRVNKQLAGEIAYLEV